MALKYFYKHLPVKPMESVIEPPTPLVNTGDEEPAVSTSPCVLNDVNTFLERCPLEIAQKIVRLYVRDGICLALVQEVRDRRGCARVPHESNCHCDSCDCMEWHDAYCDGTCERCQEYELKIEYEQHEKVCQFTEGCYTPASPYCNHVYD